MILRSVLFRTGIEAGSDILSNAKLAVLYSNRSAAYVGQGQLDLACHDADTAVSLRSEWCVASRCIIIAAAGEAAVV